MPGQELVCRNYIVRKLDPDEYSRLGQSQWDFISFNYAPQSTSAGLRGEVKQGEQPMTQTLQGPLAMSSGTNTCSVEEETGPREDAEE